MRKLAASVAVAALAGGVVLAGAGPASAETVRASCATGENWVDHLDVSAAYTVDGAIQHWDFVEWIFGGPDVHNRSDTHIRLRHSANVVYSIHDKTYWTYDSSDDEHPDTAYSTSIDKNVPTNDNIYLKVETFFDRRNHGGDDSCRAYTPFV
jgi:hypothetical protein